MEIWLQGFTRRFLQDGRFERWIRDHGIRGAVQDAALLHRAMAENGDYDEAVAAGTLRGTAPDRVIEEAALDDARRAADFLRGVHDRSGGRSGLVTLDPPRRIELDPEAAARRAEELVEAAGRPNVLAALPAFEPLLPAIAILVERGVPLNVTHITSLSRYRMVTEAWMSGLERRLGRGLDAGGAGFFATIHLEPIDRQVQPGLDALVGAREKVAEGKDLEGRAAVSTACMAHRAAAGLVREDERFLTLSRAGGVMHTLVWGALPAVAERAEPLLRELASPYVVATVPHEVLGRIEIPKGSGIEEGMDEADRTLRRLEVDGIPMERIARELDREAVGRWTEGYDRLRATAEEMAERLAPRGA
ncbi:MAG TPA: transaldolase family protein [Candidatus Polarisedimenticolia bacterium]|nr:transaldolase family protein [Candidatus Polarisedimenticolia bacterium]